MTLAIITATCGAACFEDARRSWQYGSDGLPLPPSKGYLIPPVIVVENKPMMQAYDEGWRKTDADIVAHLHDDVLLTEPAQGVWERVLKVFEDKTVGMVGFGGALRHGHQELYRKPYVLTDLARYDYMSNQEDAEVHGKRFEGEREVAVIDGFALIIRRSILERAGGWPQNSPVGYIAYDQWAGFMTHRFGYRIMLVAAQCLHLGGQTSTKQRSPENEHANAHKYIYENFSDVLPWEVK